MKNKTYHTLLPRIQKTYHTLLPRIQSKLDYKQMLTRLFIYLWVLTFPLLDCSEFGNFVITLIYTRVSTKFRASFFKQGNHIYCNRLKHYYLIYIYKTAFRLIYSIQVNILVIVIWMICHNIFYRSKATSLERIYFIY